MARAYGSSAHLLMKRETGQAATGDYIRMPFNRCNLGAEQGLIMGLYRRRPRVRSGGPLGAATGGRGGSGRGAV
jgi:hypothetical protein